MLTYEQINILLNMLTKPGRELSYSSIDRTILNKSFDEKIESWKTLIEYHFAFAEREDTPYWKYVTEDLEYEVEENIYNLYKWTNPFLSGNILKELKFDNVTREVILTAFKGNIISNYLLDNLLLNNQNYEEIQMYIKYFEEQIKNNKLSLTNTKFKTHYQYLLDNIYN
jgi:hypothetical protein